MLKVQKQLRQKSTPKKAEQSKRFFKMGPGEYSEGDIFIGVTVPEIRQIAKQNQDLGREELKKLLESPYHEDRLLSLMIMTHQYQAYGEKDQKIIFNFYIKNRKRINNWDLVDSSAHKILGDFCLKKNDDSKLRQLIKSKIHWDRRLAMVATLAYIRSGQIEITFELARIVLQDKEVLMHKATGWMLREAGKKNLTQLLKFIDQHGSKMPRTMLRYCIERLPEPSRLKILANTRKNLNRVLVSSKP